MKHFYRAQNSITPGSTVGALNAITDLNQWQDWLVLFEQDLQADRDRWAAFGAAMKPSKVLCDSSIANTGTPTS